MSKIILPKQHPLIRYCSDLRLICHPIIETFKLNIFVYIRYFHDGSCIVFSTNDEFLQFHLSQGYMVPAPIPETLLHKPEAFHVVPNDGPFQQAKYDLLQRFHSGEAVDYIKRYPNYIDVICFAFWEHDKYAINTIVNSLDELKRAAVYVSDSISPVLQNYNQFKINLPAEMRGIHFTEERKPTVFDDQKKCKFTQQQLRIMHWVTRGKSAREIAEHMHLSRRTIEGHMVTLKMKLSVSSKSELIEKYQHIYSLTGK